MRFEETLRNELIKAYVETFGLDSWNNKNEIEKSETLHELLGSFLAVAKQR